MKNTRKILVCSLLLLCCLPGCAPAFAQRHEVGLTLGRFVESRRTSAGSALKLKSGTALQANYGYRLAKRPGVSVLAEVHLLASPLRDITSGIRSATRDFATLYVTPGIRVKLLPELPVSPYLAVGGGYAQYEHSDFQIDGQPNPAPHRVHRGALDFGGGIDIKVWRFLGIRAEIRDFYTGSPNFNTLVSGGQHNVVAGGGFLLAWGR